MYLVTGSTGNIGRALVSVLLEQGHQVRALVRDATRARGQLPAEAEIAVGDLNDGQSVAVASRGVEGVFHLQATPGVSQTQVVIDAARSADVRKIVALTSMGAILKPAPIIGADFVAREELLRHSGLDVTYVRPGNLMSNAFGWANGIRSNGRVVDPVGEGRLASVDTDDVARVAAVALTEPGHVSHGYLLTGPESLTSREQVAILAEVLGSTIEFEDVTPEQIAVQNAANGMPRESVDALLNLQEMFRAGRASMITDDVYNVTGIAANTFRDWCIRNAGAFA